MESECECGCSFGCIRKMMVDGVCDVLSSVPIVMYMGGTMSSQPRYVPTEVHDQDPKVLVVMVAQYGGHHHGCHVGLIDHATEGQTNAP